MRWHLLSLAVVASAPRALAWGAAGHEIVATVAQILLTPTARSELCAILPAYAKCHLAPVASWADTVRNPYTGPMHYVNGIDDWPGDHCAFGENGWKDPVRNVLVGVVNNTRNVAILDGHERDFALRYLVHFLGDLHMPLHLTGRDRGGNNNRVRFDGRITNLHSVWDGRLIANSLRTLTNYTQPLPSRQIESALNGAIYDSYVRFITWEGLLGWWKDEYVHWADCPSEMTSTLEGISASLFPPSAPSFSSQQAPLLLKPRVPDIPDLPVCPLHWARPIHTLNCNSTLIWPRFLSEIPPHADPLPPTPARNLTELDTPAYAGRIRSELVIEKLLTMGGVRLAAVLNELLDPEGAEALKQQRTGGVWIEGLKALRDTVYN